MELYKCLVCNDKVTTSKRTKICIVCRRKLYTEKDLEAINNYLRKLQESVEDVPLLPAHRVKKEKVNRTAHAQDAVLPFDLAKMSTLACREKQMDKVVARRALRAENDSSAVNDFVIQHSSEREFVENYFTHDQWVHHPATFCLTTCTYTPDFYDKVRGVFIEVASTKQAYARNLNKYFMMKEEYPLVPFEVRRNTGILIDIEKHINWDQPQITLKELREMSPNTEGLEMIKVDYRFGRSK